MTKPLYRRVLLKFSGEALAGDGGFGIDPAKALDLAHDLYEKRDARIDDKWGPAGAIRVKQRASKNRPRMDGWLFFGIASE